MIAGEFVSTTPSTFRCMDFDLASAYQCQGRAHVPVGWDVSAGRLVPGFHSGRPKWNDNDSHTGFIGVRADSRVSHDNVFPSRSRFWLFVSFAAIPIFHDCKAGRDDLNFCPHLVTDGLGWTRPDRTGLALMWFRDFSRCV